MRLRKAFLLYTVYLLLTIGAVFLAVKFRHKKEVWQFDGNLSCAIALEKNKPGIISFSTGYNYEALRALADSLDFQEDIRLAGKEENLLDSLLKGRLDLIAVPAGDSLIYKDSIVCSRTLPDSSVWLLSEENSLLIKEIDNWLDICEPLDSISERLERFLPSYEPFARRRIGFKFKNISPYDKLIKKHAQSIGWDWRLLTALIWQESRFKIEARSKRGAEGLMQMVPRTARSYSNDDMLDPEKNLEAACCHLQSLIRMFKPYADNNQELTRFVLAAYNAGQGRILECIELAKAEKMPYSNWEDLVKVIALMDNFKGRETIAYIEKIEELLDCFLAISPGQS